MKYDVMITRFAPQVMEVEITADDMCDARQKAMALAPNLDFARKGTEKEPQYIIGTIKDAHNSGFKMRIEMKP